MRSGIWLGMLPGRPVYRGDRELFVADGLGVTLVPRDHWWMAWFAFDRDFSLYVDIVTPPVVRGTSITMIDLDLDVIRWSDGRVELLDEDEFEDHRVRLGYPDDVVAGALASGRHVLAAVQAGEPPFDAPGERWSDLVRTRAAQAQDQAGQAGRP